jgi:hypothetical protein
MAERDTSGDVSTRPRAHGSPLVRVLFLLGGITSLGLGIAGVFLPVLPTTPFVILAAACFARSYRPFHEWLLAHRSFGPTLREWHEHRAIPYRTKLTAIAMMAAAMTASIVLFVEPLWLDVLLAAFGVGLAVWMYRLPSRDR